MRSDRRFAPESETSTFREHSRSAANCLGALYFNYFFWNFDLRRGAEREGTMLQSFPDGAVSAILATARGRNGAAAVRGSRRVQFHSRNCRRRQYSEAPRHPALKPMFDRSRNAPAQQGLLVHSRLRTPRAAAIAGIVFSCAVYQQPGDALALAAGQPARHRPMADGGVR